MNDADPRVVLEAARAIHDLPMPSAIPKLASLIVWPTQDEALLRRVLNANFRLGGRTAGTAVAEFATRTSSPPAMRVEALRILENWTEPSSRDRVLGMWRPLDSRDPELAVAALKRALPGLLTAADDVRNEAIRVAA